MCTAGCLRGEHLRFFRDFGWSFRRQAAGGWSGRENIGDSFVSSAGRFGGRTLVASRVARRPRREPSEATAEFLLCLRLFVPEVGHRSLD